MNRFNEGVLVFVLAMALGCGGDDNPASSVDTSAVAGTYSLQTITSASDGVEIEFDSFTGSLTLSSGGAYSLTVSMDGFGSETASGTFTVVGNTIQFDDGTRGTRSGNQITIVDVEDGTTTTLVFSK